MEGATRASLGRLTFAILSKPKPVKARRPIGPIGANLKDCRMFEVKKGIWLLSFVAPWAGTRQSAPQ